MLFTLPKSFFFFMLLLPCVYVAQAQQSRITGTVVEARGGQPQQGVTVVVVGTLYAAVTDADGRFALGPMPPGTYAVEVNALGFQTQRLEVDLAADAEADIAFRLRPPEVEVESIEAAALQRALQPVEGMQARRLREINAHETGQLLRALPGADAARLGALDFEPVIRGLWGNQVGVFVDGARYLAGSPYGFGAPLSLFDPYAVERIEVVKGPYALTWGAGTLSAIRLTTHGAPRAGTRLRSSFRAGYTSKHNAFDAAGALAGTSGKASYRLQGTYRTGNDYDDGDDRTVPADFQAVAVRGQTAYRFRTSTRFVLQAGYQDRNNLAAPAHVFPGASAEAADVSARFQTAWADGAIRVLDAAVYWNRRAETHEAVNTGPAPEGGRLVLGVEAEQTQRGGRLAAQLVPIKGWTLEIGGDVYSILYDTARRVTVTVPFGPVSAVLREARLTDAGLFANGARTFGNVEATGTLRLDVVHARADLSETFLRTVGLATGDVNVTETNLSAAFALTAGLSSAWQVSAGIGSAVRTADAYERYGDQAPFRRVAFINDVMGNPRLKPERSTQADLWLRGSYPRLDVQLNAFVRRLSNYITLPFPPDEIVPPADTPLGPSYINSNATFYGAEGLVHYAVMGEFVTATIGGRYLWGHDDMLDEPAFGIAPASVVAGGRLDAPASLFFMEGLLRGVFEQTRVARSHGERPGDGYLTADLRFGVTLPRSASLVLGVDNLLGKGYANHLNAPDPISAIRLAEPGRVFYIRLRYGV